MLDMNNPLVKTFLGESTGSITGPAMPQQPWQQELMAAVNPEKVRRQNMAKALLAASGAMASTPGSFLTGLSAGAVQGAQAYQKGQEDSEAQRVRAMREIDTANQQYQNTRLDRLRSALGLQQDIEGDAYRRERDRMGDARTAEADAYSREKDERDFALRQQQADSVSAYRNRRNEIAAAKAGIDATIGKRPGDVSGLTEDQRRKALDSVNRFTNDFIRRREAAVTDSFASREEKQVQMAEIAREAEAMKQALMREYGLDQSPPAAPPAPGVTKQGAKAVPPDIMKQARDAIARGADPAAVRQRLIDNGFDGAGF